MTICTHDRQPTFGEVMHDHVALNAFGALLARIWARTVNGGRLPEAHDFVVMLNHVHGVSSLPEFRNVRARWDVGARRPSGPLWSPTTKDLADRSLDPALVDASPLRIGPEPGSLGALVGAFKSQTTHAVNVLRATPGARVWQRGYYERIVRDDEELQRVRQYILDNPAKWAEDPNNPATGDL